MVLFSTLAIECVLIFKFITLRVHKRIIRYILKYISQVLIEIVRAIKNHPTWVILEKVSNIFTLFLEKFIMDPIIKLIVAIMSISQVIIFLSCKNKKGIIFCIVNSKKKILFLRFLVIEINQPKNGAAPIL